MGTSEKHINGQEHGQGYEQEESRVKGLSSLYTERAKGMHASVIREICKLIARPEVRSMAGGWPDPQTFPAAKIAEIAAELFAGKPESVLQYGTSEGYEFLREELARFVERRDGIEVTRDEIVLTHGSTQGIELAARILLEPGDVAFVGLPTYFGGSETCAGYGAELVGVPLDEYGMIPEALGERLEEVVKAGKKPKLVYVIPDYQNPTGATMPVERRKAVVELANRYNIAVIEDNPYRDLSFTGESLPPIKAFDTEGRVVYLRSFSKIFCPGFRLAMAIGEKDMIRKMVIARQFEDCCVNSFGQYLLYEFVKRGHLDEQIDINARFYKEKRNHLLALLDEHFPGTVHWNRPEGGFFVFVHMGEGFDSEKLLHEAVDQNVAFVAGSPFFIDGSGRDTFRLSFAQLGMKEMEGAVEVLGRLLKDKTA